jgi:hypothetical protein
MIREEMSRNFNFGMAAFGLAIGASVAILAAGATTVVGPTSAQASAKYTAQTKQPCTRCHMAAKGASADNLTAFGKDFQANDHKLPKKK